MSKTLYKTLSILLVIILTSCGTTSTEKPEESYLHWTGQEPPKDMKVIKESYWKSGHWTREYIVYLKLQSTKSWRTEFILQNKLISDTSKWILPEDAPKWFTPAAYCIKWKAHDDFQGSRYLLDTLTGNFYVYEIQL